MRTLSIMFFILLLSARIYFVVANNGCETFNNKDASCDCIKNEKFNRDTLRLGVINNLDSFFLKTIDYKFQNEKISASVSYEVKRNKGRETRIYHLDLPFGFEFKSTEYKNCIKRKIFVGGKLLTSQFINLDSNTISSKKLIIDYSQTDFYRINNSKLILAISYPMNFTGLMSNFSLFQLMDIENMRLFEFIEFGNSPLVVIDRGRDVTKILKLSGSYNIEKKIWLLNITTQILGKPIKDEFIPIKESVNSEKKTKCIIVEY